MSDSGLNFFTYVIASFRPIMVVISHELTAIALFHRQECTLLWFGAFSCIKSQLEVSLPD